MDAKIIVRLLDKDNRLLGWGVLMAVARGDGALWATDSLSGWGESDGETSSALMHWADVHAQWRAPITGVTIKTGQAFLLRWEGPVLRLDNPLDHPPLPPVTIRGPVSIGVPTGTVGLRKD